MPLARQAASENRRSDADRASLEGRVLDKPSPTLEFSRSSVALRPRETEKSVIFVGPPILRPFAEIPPAPDEIALSVDDPDVHVSVADPGPVPFANSPPILDVTPAPVGHWVTPLRSLAQDDLRLSGDWTSTLPVVAISRARRPSLTAGALWEGILGRSTSARATRLGLAFVLVFSGFALATMESPTGGQSFGGARSLGSAPVAGAKSVRDSSPTSAGPGLPARVEAPGLVFDPLALRVLLPPPNPAPRAVVPAQGVPAESAAGRLFGPPPAPLPRTEVAGL